jgi:hypothetical protein
MLLTYSSIQAFKSCRRRYKYRYVDGLELKERPLYFSFGTAIHLALGVHYKGGSLTDSWNEIEKHFNQNMPAEDDPERMDEWRKANTLAIDVFQNYIVQYPKESFKVLEIEKLFELPIMDVRGEKYPGIILAGKVDLLVEENGLWIVETKTTSALNVGYKRKLTLDPQAMLYLDAMDRTMGQRVKGVIYNVLVKDVPHKPEVLKSGKLSKAVNAKTSPELYRAAIAELNLNEADYADHLEYLEDNRKEYFYREYLVFGDEERMEWKEELRQIAGDMERMVELGAFYRNPAQCVTFGTCPYLPICEAPCKEAVIEQSYVKKQAHAELEVESE